MVNDGKAVAPAQKDSGLTGLGGTTTMRIRKPESWVICNPDAKRVTCVGSIPKEPLNELSHRHEGGTIYVSPAEVGRGPLQWEAFFTVMHHEPPRVGKPRWRKGDIDRVMLDKSEHVSLSPLEGTLRSVSKPGCPRQPVRQE